MDKGCGTCAHAGTPSYKSPCSECVASGTFSGWTAKVCENCTNRFVMGLENGPCKACFAGKVYSEWKGNPTDAELNAKDEQSDDAEKTCGTCAHFLKGGNEEPCKTCNGSSMWEHMPTDAELAQTAEDMKPDDVNHPTHYTSGCGFECIEMMEMVFGKEAVHDFCTLNAFKYLWRYRQKGGADDIGKAKWYLEYTKGLNVFKNRQAIDKMKEHISKEEANE